MLLVTGACGHLGRALVDRLLAGGAAVRSFDLRPHPDPRVESHVGDIRDSDAVVRACAGVHTVFHTAAVIHLGLGRDPDVHAVNVGGTTNVIAACRAAGVRRLVATSSQDVVYGGRPIAGGDEALPYPARHLDCYGETKAEAERLVRGACDADLLTCAIRPTGIYGPHDNQRFPPILRAARAGRLFYMGDGRARFSHVYVENVAHAHLLAADRLGGGSPAAGAAYFVTDSEPANFIAFFVPFLEGLGLRPPTHRIPGWALWATAATCELLWRVAPSERTANPTLTRFIVGNICDDLWFTSVKAQRELGYAPIVDEVTARASTLAWLRDEWLPAERRATAVPSARVAA
jgi:sterol-4alpha-carboxylate 3-dehydrogenase (decarboxylating)